MVPLTFNKYIGASSSEMFSSLDYSARDACKLKCIAGYNIQSSSQPFLVWSDSSFMLLSQVVRMNNQTF